MIELLSCEKLINPQIDFLLYLQNLRICHFSMLDNLFLSITIMGEMWLPTVVCAIVYWCFDIKTGIYLFSLSSFNVFFAQLFKMLACVYRPWILSDKIQPVEKAVALAAGYSFPSGHSAQASSLFGGLAFLLRKKILVSILLVILVFIVGFSRMWLGVHTPQDVVIGLIIGFSLVFIFDYIINWAELNKNRYLYLALGTDILIAFIIIYICYFNCYPIDYVNGILLVSPRMSIQASILCYGFVAGVLNGVYISRRFPFFNPNQYTPKNKLIISLIGSAFIIAMFKLYINPLFCEPNNFKIVFMIPFLSGIFITSIYPYIFEKLIKFTKKAH